MKIKLSVAALSQSKWYEHLLRFFTGGAITALTGITARRFGPVIGGLFLAFPAILPATATLIEKHEKEKKEQVGKNGLVRARAAAAVDAAGAAMGSIGLLGFAVIVWRGIRKYPAGLVLSVATLAWSLVAVLIWGSRDRIWRLLRRKFLAAANQKKRKPKGLPYMERSP